jgi:hypothetical protein
MRIRVSPTPSITPSHTPTITPSLTSCPTYGWNTNIKLFECNYGQTQVGLPLTGWTVEHSGITYTGLTEYTSPQEATWCNIPVQEPFVGASYIFNLTELPAGWQLCPDNSFGVSWDSFDVVLTAYNGRNCYSLTECFLDYSAVINYYLGGVLQSSQNEVIQFTEYLVSENPECPPRFTMLNQVMGFVVDVIRPTLTPTQTQTQTPSPTSCYQPKAYVLFDSQTGATALNTWMASQGSTFRGMFISAPSLVPATFEAQMNAYINYSGFGPSQYYALLPQTITPNQDPIVWPAGGGPSWSGTFVWTNMFVPTCPICPEGEYGLMGANGTAIHTTNDARRSIPFYYSGTVIPQGFYRLYTTYALTDMRLSSSGSEYVLGGLVCPTTPTPTPTQTQTRTPTQTQTQTPTRTLPVTPTPTQTQTGTPQTTSPVTPTPTQTQTGTLPVEYYYYSIKKYDCNNSCAYVSPDLVGRSSTPLSTFDGMYRKIGSFVYQVQTEITPPPITYDIDLDTATNTDLNCATACETPPVDECICYQYTNDGDPDEVNSISYLDCSYQFQQIDNIPLGTSGYFCAILGSVQETEGLTYIEVNESFCGGCIADPQLCISVYNNSLDITVTDVYVNGTQATPIGVWPNTTGNGGSLTIALVPGTYSVEVFHSCSVSGQKVSVLDSNSINQCSPISTGSSSTTFSGVAMDNIQCLLISAEDGAC